MPHGPFYLWQLQYQAKTGPVKFTAPFAETVSVDRWLQPLSLPTPPKPGLHASRQPFQPYNETQQFPETVTESRWHQPWSEPVRVKPALPAGEQQTLAFAPNPIIKIDWFNELSKPSELRKLGLGTAAQQPLALAEAAPFPETVSEDRWHQPWSDPVRRATNAALQSTTAFTAVVTTTASVDGWGTALSTPIQLSTPWKTADRSVGFGVPQAQATPTIDGWGQPLSPPTPPKAGTHASRQQFLAYTESAPFPESISEDRWHQGWADPIQLRAPWKTSNNTSNFAAIRAATVFEDSWHQRWTDPIQFSIPWKTGDNSVSFGAQATAAPSIDGWGSPFAEVPKPKVGVNVSAQQALAFVPVITTTTVFEGSWHQRWTDPIQLCAPWKTVNNTNNFAAIQAAVATIDGWGTPFAAMPRPKAGTIAAAQQFLAFDPQPFPSAQVFEDSWHQRWADPIQLSTPWKTGDNSVAFGAVQATQVLEDSWHQPWTDPVQNRVPWKTANNTVNFAAIPAATPSFGYFSPFSEPQRQIAGLAARLQQSTANGFVPIVPPFVFFFGNEEPMPWPGFRQNQLIRENFDAFALPPFPIPNPPQTQAKFTVSGPSVSDLFPVSGVVYPYAPETRKTVP